MTRADLHRNIYLMGISMLVCSLPFSVFMMSVSQFIIIINWFVEGGYAQKWRRLKQESGILIFSSIFILHVLGMLYSSWDSDTLKYGFSDLRIKLPMLLLPFYIGTSPALNAKEIKRLLYLFAASVIAGTIISSYILLVSNTAIDFRSSSLFISHIRFSLMMVFSIFILFYYGVLESKKPATTIIHFLLIVWLLFSIFIMRSLTGVFIFLATGIFLFFQFYMQVPRLMRVFALLLMVSGILVVLGIGGKAYKNYYTIKTNIDSLNKYTTSGNAYLHLKDNDERENGHLVWCNVCEDELKKEWTKRSQIIFDSLDKKKNYLKYTLFRYMSSRGFSKDSVGMALMTDADVMNVENGYANYIYAEKKGLYPRIYEVIWEIDYYRKSRTTGGHSVTQRFEFVRTGWGIFKENIWLGVGTGNVKKAFNEMYEKQNSPLIQKYRLKAHNQYLTFLISFGVIGLLLILIVLFYLPWKKKLFNNFLFVAVFVISMLSWLNEDTLETQAGVTFFTVFIVIYLFGIKHDNE